jgi:ATP-dependent protease ClpP protease subunit
VSGSNSDFRPNPDRGVFLNDLVGPEMLRKLVPEILALKAANSEPITLYIDSFGGNTFYARSLRELLRSPDQDGSVRPLITVVTGFAASSAADLLAAGNYSLAYQHARIICHGNRQEDREIVSAMRTTSCPVLGERAQL